ncbi:MAG: ACT domain-containing protein [Candidatus Omnitrophota bacterium]|nr:ACT domain-containing protein [Candidatus Omnitrophota bacterium]
MIDRIKQLTVVTEDKAGMLSEVVNLIAAQNVNINAIDAYGMQGKARFHIITEDNQKASSALQAKGWEVKEEEVVAIDLENKPGVLAGIAAKLRESDVNLLYCYGSAGGRGIFARFVMKAEDNDKAVEVLG